VVSFTPRPLSLGEIGHGTYWIVGWVGPRTGLDDVEKSLDTIGTRTRTLQSYNLVSCYADCPIPALRSEERKFKSAICWQSDLLKNIFPQRLQNVTEIMERLSYSCGSAKVVSLFFPISLVNKSRESKYPVVETSVLFRRRRSNIFFAMLAYVMFTYPCGQTLQDCSSNRSASELSHW
jgi:hypothetical protein